MLTLSPDSSLTRSSNPFEAARLTLIQRLLQIRAPKPIGAFALPSDFLAIRDHIVDAVEAFDDWIESIGFQVQENSPRDIDMRLFEDTFSAAVHGNALFELEELADETRDAQADAARGRRVA